MMNILKPALIILFLFSIKGYSAEVVAKTGFNINQEELRSFKVGLFSDESLTIEEVTVDFFQDVVITVDQFTVPVDDDSMKEFTTLAEKLKNIKLNIMKNDIQCIMSPVGVASHLYIGEQGHTKLVHTEMGCWSVELVTPKAQTTKVAAKKLTADLIKLAKTHL